MQNGIVTIFQPFPPFFVGLFQAVQKTYPPHCVLKSLLHCTCFCADVEQCQFQINWLEYVSQPIPPQHAQQE